MQNLLKLETDPNEDSTLKTSLKTFNTLTIMTFYQNQNTSQFRPFFPNFANSSVTVQICLNPKFSLQWGEGVRIQLSKVNFKLSNLSPKLKFPFSGGGRGEGLVTPLVHNGMLLIWCCHLACIWGELKNFDKNICNFCSAFASQ